MAAIEDQKLVSLAAASWTRRGRRSAKKALENSMAECITVKRVVNEGEEGELIAVYIHVRLLTPIPLGQVDRRSKQRNRRRWYTLVHLQPTHSHTHIIITHDTHPIPDLQRRLSPGWWHHFIPLNTRRIRQSMVTTSHKHNNP